MYSKAWLALYFKDKVKDNVHCWKRRQHFHCSEIKRHILTVQITETKRDWDEFWCSHVTIRCPKDNPRKIQERHLFSLEYTWTNKYFCVHRFWSYIGKNLFLCIFVFQWMLIKKYWQNSPEMLLSHFQPSLRMLELLWLFYLEIPCLSSEFQNSFFLQHFLPQCLTFFLSVDKCCRKVSTNKSREYHCARKCHFNNISSTCGICHLF